MNATEPKALAVVITDALLEGRVDALAPLASEVAAQFDASLAALVARIQANHDADAAPRGPHWPRSRYYAAGRKGSRFIAVWETGAMNPSNAPRSGRRIVGFVERGTGLLYKAATWKAPALNFTRGCMFNLPPGWAVGTFGVSSFG